MPAADSVVLTQQTQKRRVTPTQWSMSLALMLALSSAMAGLGAAFTDASYWFVAIGIATLVTIGMVATRIFSRRRFLVPLVGFAVGIIGLTFSFAPSAAFLGFIPTPDVFDEFWQLVGAGSVSISEQSIPAKPVAGIVFLVSLGAVALTIALDITAFVVQRPALVGIPLLGILLVPTFFHGTDSDPFFFFLTAAAYLLVLYLGLGEVRTAGAIGVGAAAVTAALILPFVLPPLAEPESNGSSTGLAVGINSFIKLGDNLRLGSDTRVLKYTTNSERGVYLTVSVIDLFEGSRWSPAEPRNDSDFEIEDIGPVPGIPGGVEDVEADSGVVVETTTTAITILNMGGHWLPAPYAPRAVAGADPNWTFDPESLTINSSTESARGEAYAVSSALAAPSVAELRATGTSFEGDMTRYLALPDRLPDSVGQTAVSVVGSADTHFDMAIALQSYFTGGQFEYSETAPVDEDYDGTSGQVIGEFLTKKSGYCVQFSSAMAVMARTLGIPSRIAVGFTPGEFVEGTDDEPGFFAVTTRNLHAWPELWFDGVGWVRFEPTASRGEAPLFEQTATTREPTDPLNPTANPTSTRAPTARPSATATQSAAAGDSSEPADLTVPRITIAILVVAAIVVMLLPLVPMLVRIWRRAARYRRVRRHASAADAWHELIDTAIDLGWHSSTTTPRQFALLLGRRMPAQTVAALARLLRAIEATAYSPALGSSTLTDVRAVRAAMGKASTRTERLRALFTPASARKRSTEPQWLDSSAPSRSRRTRRR